jgi:hypothetical protein
MSSPAAIQFVAVNFARSLPMVRVPELDKVMLLGFVSAFFALVCYFNRRYSRAFGVGLALSLIGMAVYAFLQNVWPIGIAEAVWSVVALVRCRKPKTAEPQRIGIIQTLIRPRPRCWETESRMLRMFGRN